MKKLMIAAAIVCVAAFAQASTVTWGYSGDIVNHNYDGGTSTEKFWTGADAYVLFLGATGAFEVGSDGAVTLSGSAVQIGTGVVDDGLMTSFKKEATTDGVYTLLLVSSDPTDGTWYGSTTANVTGLKAEASDPVAVEFAIADSSFDAGYKPIALSTQAVPEPTSGLLLLLGVAGLALRRRRA